MVAQVVTETGLHNVASLEARASPPFLTPEHISRRKNSKASGSSLAAAGLRESMHIEQGWGGPQLGGPSSLFPDPTPFEQRTKILEASFTISCNQWGLCGSEERSVPSRV